MLKGSRKAVAKMGCSHPAWLSVCPLPFVLDLTSVLRIVSGSSKSKAQIVFLAFLVSVTFYSVCVSFPFVVIAFLGFGFLDV